jgi:hypothetical protein
MWIRTTSIVAVLSVTALTLVSAFPSPPRALLEPGLCSTVTTDANGRSVFNPIAEDVENLETCGARLEAVRILTSQPVFGAYQGVYVVVDDRTISVGATLEGPHRQLISRGDRSRIDAAIRELIRRRAQERRRDQNAGVEISHS